MFAWRGERARGSPRAFTTAIRVQNHLLHMQVSLSCIGPWLQGGIAGGSVRKCSWPSQRLPGAPRTAAAGGQGCRAWKDALCEGPAAVGGTAAAVTSRRLQQCSSVQRSHWCGSWHHIWGHRCTVIISPQAFCTWNSQNFSWCWTKNTLFPWNCSPSLRSVYPTAAMVKHPEESTTWSLRACGRWTLQPENILHFSNLDKIRLVNLMEEYSPKKWSQMDICEKKD